MKQAVFIVATSIALASPAYADFRAGIEVGESVTWGGAMSGNSLGVFGQWRALESDKFDIWAHLGYSSDYSSTKFESEYVYISAVTTTVKDVFEIEADSIIDLMGIVSWKGGSVNPFIMAGLSTIQIGSVWSETINSETMREDGDDSATGLKLSIGAEFPFDTAWSGYVRMDYADYGKVSLFNLPIEFETEQTGLRMGAIYNF